MSRLGFLYDQTKCIGCNACQMACKDKNNLEKGLFFRRVETLEYEENGKMICFHYSGACNHCADAACVNACPTHAMHYMEDGTVGHDAGACIACGTCTWACPYGAPKLSHYFGIARKCDSCYDLRQRGEEPACVAACVTHCLRFVDLEEETDRGDYEELSLPFLPDTEITRPSVRIKKRRAT
ncbi:MAG: 4Fe-4S dicluster domain-containing protein [Clostridiales bacterium]|nr:4Fe-4S dicluster domain-containing protein [Clostridiales bacterium]